MSAGSDCNCRVISVTMRIDVIGARTTAHRQAVIPITDIMV